MQASDYIHQDDVAGVSRLYRRAGVYRRRSSQYRGRSFLWLVTRAVSTPPYHLICVLMLCSFLALLC